MKLEFLDSRDFWTGIMLIGTGVAVMVIARDYPFGNALRMGAGYFPTMLGGALTLFGVYFAILGLRGGDRIAPNWSARALAVLPLALILFGVLMEYAGFVPALAVLIFVSAAAGTEFRLGEVALLTIGLTLCCTLVFIWGLGLPYPLFAGF